MAKSKIAATKAPATKKSSGGVSKKKGAAGDAGVAVKKNRRRRSNNFASYIQRLVSASVLSNGKKSSMSKNARKAYNTLVVGFIRQMAEHCKKLTDDRNAKTVGPKQVHFAAKLIFDRAGRGVGGEPSMADAAKEYYESKTANFLEHNKKDE